MLLLAVSLIGGLFLSNYQLKKKFDKIDTTDSYWEYSVRETGEFHHVEIIGGNLMNTKIVRGKESRLMRKENLKDWLDAEIKNDTLFVKFSKNVEVTRQKESDKWVNEWVVISIDGLRSISASKANVEINEAAAGTLILSVKNKSSIDLREPRNNTTVSVNVSDNSSFGIYKPDGKQVNFKQLDVSANQKATLVLNNVMADKGKIILKDKAKISADAGLLKNVVVE